MKTDRELLELAAKAAGFVIWKHGKNAGGFINGRAESWSPLTDDGDALRLAVKLDLIIDIDLGEHVTTVDYTAVENFTVLEPHGSDSFAATRRAIVRAAAAIGESM